MGRYASKAELIQVIKATIRASGIDPAHVNMSAVLRDIKIIGDRYYGWTVTDPGIDPATVARRHMRAGTVSAELDYALSRPVQSRLRNHPFG